MAVAAKYAKLPQSCQVCKRQDSEARAARERWGCDGPSTEGVLFEFDCVRCRGEDPDCVRCSGTGTQHATRCAFATATPQSWRVVEYLDLVEIGVLPVAGGWEDQSLTFLQALRFAAGERSKIEKRLAEAGKHR